jgi:D-alanine--D-alanine ligase
MNFIIVYDEAEARFSSTNFQKINSYHSDVNQAIQAALQANGHQADLVCVDDELPVKLTSSHPDFAFNCSSQARGDDHYAFAPHLLKENGIPFTGSGERACSDAYDKSITKEILVKAGIRTPKAFVVCQPLPLPKNQLKFPLFIKPIKGGCSSGINRESLILDQDSLNERLPIFIKDNKRPLLLEEYLPGREFTVGIMGNQKLQILPIMEFGHNQVDQPPFRSFRLKMVQSGREEICCPAELNPELRAKIEEIARRTFRALGCRDYARIDIRLSNSGQPYIIEINALPNLMPKTSSFAIMAKKGGMAFVELIQKIVSLAQARYDLQQSDLLADQPI